MLPTTMPIVQGEITEELAQKRLRQARFPQQVTCISTWVQWSITKRSSSLSARFHVRTIRKKRMRKPTRKEERDSTVQEGRRHALELPQACSPAQKVESFWAARYRIQKKRRYIGTPSNHNSSKQELRRWNFIARNYTSSHFRALHTVDSTTAICTAGKRDTTEIGS